MKIQCPHCGVKGSLAEAYAGKNVRCPKCRALFPAGREHPPAVAPDAESVPQPEENTTGAVVDGAAAAPLPGAEIDKGENLDIGPPPVEKASGGQAGGSAAEERKVPPLSEQGSIQDVPIFNLGRLINRAWNLTRGVKAPIWGGLLITYGVVLVLVVVLAALTAAAGEGDAGLVGMIVELASSALSTLFTAGLMFMGVKRATGRRVVWKDVLSGFTPWAKLLIAAILKMLLVVVGFMLLILPGIYLLVGYLFTFPLIIDKNMSPWEAMETSRKAIHKVWWKMLGLYFVVGLICFLSAIPFGIGLIWTLPLAVVLYGVVYNALFGAQTTTDYGP